jgi:dTDP-glucose 4,6-dehydratase
MPNLLITGGAGFIGSNLVRFMSEKHPDYRFVIYDKLTYAGNPDNLNDVDKSRCLFVHADICDETALEEAIRTYKVDALIHLASGSHVDRAILDASAFTHPANSGTLAILEATRKFMLRAHFVMTTMGWAPSPAAIEGETEATHNPYSAAKRQEELLVTHYVEKYGIFATSTRCVNNIGPFQYPEKVVPLFITNAIEELPLLIYGDGSQKRDYLYVLDHCEGIDLVLHHGQLGEVYDIGSGHEVMNLSLAHQILGMLDKSESLLRYVPDRPGHSWTRRLDVSKIRKLGWQPQNPYEQALQKTVNWYVGNQGWWRKIKSGSEYKDYCQKLYGIIR